MHTVGGPSSSEPEWLESGWSHRSPSRDRSRQPGRQLAPGDALPTIRDLLGVVPEIMMRAELCGQLQKIPGIKKAWLEPGGESETIRLVVYASSDSLQLRRALTKIAMDVEDKWNAIISTSVRSRDSPSLATKSSLLFDEIE